MPKEKVQMRSKRAASKQALNRLQHILVDDDDDVQVRISSDDDDVIEIDVQPPKKKYKLSHRKSSDGHDRDVIVLKTVPKHIDDSVFDMQIDIEPLAPCQRAIIEKIDKETKEMDAKVQQILKSSDCDVFYKGCYTTAIEANEKLQSILNAVQQSPSTSSIRIQPQSTLTTTVPPQSYQLVMDPRLGLIVGALPTGGGQTMVPPLQQVFPTKQPGNGNKNKQPQQPVSTVKTRRGVVKQTPRNALAPPPTTNTLKNALKGPAKSTSPITTLNKNALGQTTSRGAQPQHQFKVPPTKGGQMKGIQLKSPPQGLHIKPIQPKNVSALQLKPLSAIKAPQKVNSPGNNKDVLAKGTKVNKSVVDLTADDSRPLADTKEVSFNKLQGRTYPSLVVLARPHLRVKNLTGDRTRLDAKVKAVLMYPPTKFTEWLIQQGLLRSDQHCSIHTTKPLKLGMYSDASKFPFSGGYVWISDCCPLKFVSVFSGSLFEGTQHPPIAILKLIYHWSCQTIVQNVTQWVKVDNLYVKGMYTLLRAVCTVAVHSHMKIMGGPGVKVEVGVISLGTTSQDGNQRQVKVEVLGVLETTTKYVRLRAVEPLTELEKTYKKRFTKILEPIMQWVHPQSVIVTDLTVDKSSLRQMGFMNVVQSTSSDYNNSNRTIMEYLRRIVPRMFQNTLSLLSRQIIQQFLDELVWREWYGTTLLHCFENIVLHLSEQTRGSKSQSLIMLLNKVSSNPFRHWPLDRLNSTAASINNSTGSTSSSSLIVENKRYSRTKKVPVTPPPLIPFQEVNRPLKSISPDLPEQMVPIESYYYGSIDVRKVNKNKLCLNIKCSFCKATFNNNIALMDHLFKHAHCITDNVHICRYCLTILSTANLLSKHIATSHPSETKVNSGFVCLICETQFMNPFILGKHMSKEHCPYELPYLCGTCNFRCSNHKMAIDHFYFHHNNGSSIQCPFCLKSITIYSSGRNVAQNMTYFIHHLQKHQKKQVAKKCGKCNLWFVQKDFLKDHLSRMHVSQRGKVGLIPATAPKNGVMVPKSKLDKSPGDAEIINFGTIHFCLSKSLLCKECNKSIGTNKHFPSYETCQNCPYSTCCRNAMNNHNLKCRIINATLPTDKLPCEMFCICGFSSTNGNILAKHLTACERKSAYSSLQAAQSATVTHSMLDVLGLVRKPEEASTSSESGTSSKDVTKISSETIINNDDIDDDDGAIIETTVLLNRDESLDIEKISEKQDNDDDVMKVDDDVLKSAKTTIDDDDDDNDVVETVVEKLVNEMKESTITDEETTKNKLDDSTTNDNDIEIISDPSPMETDDNDSSGVITKQADDNIVADVVAIELDDDDDDDEIDNVVSKQVANILKDVDNALEDDPPADGLKEVADAAKAMADALHEMTDKSKEIVVPEEEIVPAIAPIEETTDIVTETVNAAEDKMDVPVIEDEAAAVDDVEEAAEDDILAEEAALDEEIADNALVEEIVADTLDETADGLNEVVSASTEETIDLPTEAVDVPIEAADAPIEAGDAPIEAADGPIEAADAPIEAADAPIEAGDAPIEAADAPIEAADASIETADLQKEVAVGALEEIADYDDDNSGSVNLPVLLDNNDVVTENTSNNELNELMDTD